MISQNGIVDKKNESEGVINIEKYVMICLLKILYHVLVVFRVCFDELNDTIMTGKVIFSGCLKA